MTLRLGLAFAFLAACSSSSSESIPPAPAPVAASGETAPAPTDAPPTPSAPPPARTAPASGSAGCLKAATPGVQSTFSITAKGRARTAVRVVPAGYDSARAYPLVFVFHSGGGTGAKARDYFGFGAFAENEAVFVYPDGTNGEWDLESPAAENADVALFDALLADARDNLCVDASRVFATGTSMGAYFANQLGCRRGNELRAIAPHAGSGPYDVDSAYDEQGHLRCAERPVAAMIFHGDKDTSVKLEDGKASRDHWAWANGCKGAPVATSPSPCVKPSRHASEDAPSTWPSRATPTSS